jgi:uncharacterized protein DUF6884
MAGIYLVSCVSSKLSRAAPAGELYVSPWFKKARALVLAKRAPWFILSAEHGLVRPDVVVTPYEKTLNTISVGERRAWAKRVMQQMDTDLPAADGVVILAGARYREFLLDYLKARFAKVELPMEGLKIGEQLHWLEVNTPSG